LYSTLAFLPMALLHGSLATSTAIKRRLFLVAAAKPPQLKIFSFCSFASLEADFRDFSASARKKAKLQCKVTVPRRGAGSASWASPPPE